MQDAPMLAGMPEDVLISNDGADPAAPPGPISGAAADRGGAAEPRLRRADRAQIRWVDRSLDEELPPDHAVRTIWAIVSRTDTSAFEEGLAARGSAPGRAATDPKILIALWLYAATEGVGAGRELARLCERHDAYRWILGGVSMNYHTLNDFRVGHGAALDKLFTTLLALLINKELVGVARVAHDGMRVRASAGSSSFHRRGTLEKNLREAKAHVEALKQQSDADQGTQEHAARERAARDKQARLEAALEQMPEVEAAWERQRPSRKPKDGDDRRAPRVSSTDPEARRMKMPDNGTRPAYNVQLAVDTGSRAIVGVRVVNHASDANQAPAMVQAVEERTGGQVQELLADGGFAQHHTIDALAARGTTLYAPVPEANKEGIDPHQPKPDDSAAVAAWRTRMATDDAKTLYKERGSTIETVNADLKEHRGLDRFNVRGTAKVLCVALWSVLAYTLMHFGPNLLA